MREQIYDLKGGEKTNIYLLRFLQKGIGLVYGY